MINYEDKEKLKIVKDYTPSELMTIIVFLEGGMSCDRFGRPYTREYIKKIFGEFIDTLAERKLVKERNDYDL